MEVHIVEDIIIPEVPKVVPGEQLYVYVPNATFNTAGIASYDSSYFSIFDSKVSLSTTFVQSLQRTTDNRLQTENKAIVDAINEVNSKVEHLHNVGAGTIVNVNGEPVKVFNADTKLDVTAFEDYEAKIDAILDQSEILTIEEQTSQYNEQVTANGADILNASTVKVNKVEGNTVFSTNLLSFPYYSGGIGKYERQGITFDVQKDGSIHVYGTATGGDATFIVARNDNNTPFDFLQAGVIYKVGVADSGVNTVMQGASGYISVTGNYTEILYNLAVYSYFFNVPNGTTVDTIIYPFINSSLGGFDRPLGGNLVNASFGGIESKARENLITVSTEGSIENNGITWTWNKDGSLSVKGTSNANGSTKVLNAGLDFKVQGEKYSVGEGSGGVYAYLKDSQGALTTIYSSNNSNISLDDYTEYGFYVPANTTVNAVVYPYITKGAITGYPPISNKGVKSTWNFPKTELPIGTTLNLITRQKTNTYAEYTFKGDDSELWSKGGSAPTGYERWYTDGALINIIQIVTSSAMFKDLIVCDRYPSVLSQTEYDTWNKGVAVLKNVNANINILVPTTIAETITKATIQQLTKGMTIRYPTTSANTEWYKTENLTPEQVSAGNSYEAYYKGTETVLGNDSSDAGSKNTITAEYVVVNKVGN